MSKQNSWANRERHEHNEVLCGPNCRFRPLYESTQRSLEEMSQNHIAALEVHDELRDGLISLAKRLFRGEVTEVEKGGRKLTDADDEALLMYLEGFITELASKRKPDRGGLSSLRSVLESKGYQLPEGYDIAAWVAALSVQGEDPAEGFPASSLLETRPLSDLDRELFDLLAAEGLAGEVQVEHEAQPGPSAGANQVGAGQIDSGQINSGPTGEAPAGGGLADLFGGGEAGPEPASMPGTEEAGENATGDETGTGTESASEPDVDTGGEAGSTPSAEEEAEADLAALFDNPVDLGLDDDLADDLADDLGDELADELVGAFEDGLEGDLSEMFGEEEGAELAGLEPALEEGEGEIIEPETFDTVAGPDGEILDELEVGEGDTAEGDAAEGDAAEDDVAEDETEPVVVEDSEPETAVVEPEVPAPTEVAPTETAAPSADLTELFGEPTGAEGGEAGDGRAAGEDGEVDLSELFGDIDTLVPTSSEDLAALFGDTPSEEAAKTAPSPGPADGGAQELRAPKPEFMTPGEAAGTRLRPEVVLREDSASGRGRKESKKSGERVVPREKAQRPERIKFDVPEIGGDGSAGSALTPELSTALASAAEITRPVFMSDMAEVAGGRATAEAWESEMRSVNDPPVRFLSARSHHRERGSLVLPHRMRLAPSAEFAKSWWGQALAAGYRGNTLYELAVLLAHLHDYIVSADMGEEVVVLRANLPHGLTGIILVCGDNLENGGSTREALTSAVEMLSGERLATLMVLAIRRGGENILADLLASEGAARNWAPAMPVAVDLAWKYATGRGSTAKVALGGV